MCSLGAPTLLGPVTLISPGLHESSCLQGPGAGLCMPGSLPAPSDLWGRSQAASASLLYSGTDPAVFVSLAYKSLFSLHLEAFFVFTFLMARRVTRLLQTPNHRATDQGPVHLGLVSCLPAGLKASGPYKGEKLKGAEESGSHKAGKLGCPCSPNTWHTPKAVKGMGARHREDPSLRAL